MAVDVTLPDLGDGIESGDVLEIFVNEGDTVDKDQSLFELETDKATVSIPSPAAGKLVKLAVSVGQTVAVGEVCAQLEASGGAETSAAAPAPAAESPSEPEPAAAPEPPAPTPAPAPATPAPASPAPAAAASTPTPQAPAPQASAPAAATPQPAVSSAPAASDSGPVPAGPAVQRFAREVGVDLRTVSGTGRGGRITREDVLRAVREASAKTSLATTSSTGITKTSNPVPSPMGGNKAYELPGEPGQDDYGPVRVERLSKIRKTISTQMHKSWSTVPRVTNFDDADVTDLEAFRKSSKEDYASQGIKLTTMPFLIKAVATALRSHPSINAVIDEASEQIVYRDYVNVGIAVDTERGLVVPNLRNVDSMGIPGIAKGLAELATRVRTGDFGVNELRGGTFTISNLGAIGGTYSTPIVNVPEVAILLVGRTRKLPVVMEDDSIQPRQMMPLSLSYDHRLVDGATAARFLNDVIAYLEAPSRLLLAIN